MDDKLCAKKENDYAKKYRNKIKDIFTRNEIPLGKTDKYVLFHI